MHAPSSTLLHQHCCHAWHAAAVMSAELQDKLQMETKIQDSPSHHMLAANPAVS
jgi:hypothetical protein